MAPGTSLIPLHTSSTGALPKKKKIVSKTKNQQVWKRDESLDNWQDDLLMFKDSLDAPTSHLANTIRKKKLEEKNLLDQTFKERETFENNCVSRMNEATTISKLLGTDTKYHPVFATQGGTGDVYSTRQRNSVMMCQITKGEITRLTSCEGFEKEHYKLVQKQRVQLPKINTTNKGEEDNSEPQSKDEVMNGILEKTRDLTSTFENQMQLLESNGWNM